MALKDVTPDELSIAINRVGTAEVAKLGYFHALPYGSGGGGGTSNFRVFEGLSVPSGNAPFSETVFSNLGFPEPMVNNPFTRAVVLNPVVDYNYILDVYPLDLETQSITVFVSWSYIGPDPDPKIGGNVRIGLKVEPFVLSG